jgi:hypothetical protein
LIKGLSKIKSVRGFASTAFLIKNHPHKEGGRLLALPREFQELGETGE